MKNNLNTVKKARPRDAYHHGALRPALLAAAEAVIAERGLDRFSLREAARRAGVSPAAPAHHFGDSRGLLTAVAVTAFVDLAGRMETAAEQAEGAEAKVRALGHAYVDFALGSPARFDLMWRKEMLRDDDPELKRAADHAYRLLADAAAEAMRAAGRNVSREAAESVALTCWSVVHGLSRLALDGALGADSGAAAAQARDMLPAVLDHVRLTGASD